MPPVADLEDNSERGRLTGSSSKWISFTEQHASYSYFFTNECWGCPPLEAEFTIRNGEIVSVRYTDTSLPTVRRQAQSIEELFKHLEQAVIASGSYSYFEVEYHEEWGYPIRIHANPGCVDCGSTTQITEFRILPTP